MLRGVFQARNKINIFGKSWLIEFKHVTTITRQGPKKGFGCYNFNSREARVVHCTLEMVVDGEQR